MKIHHGKDDKICYHRPNCLFCWFKGYYEIVELWFRLRKETHQNNQIKEK